MTTAINWPPSLPTEPLRSGYGEKHGVLVTSSPMDAGPAKLRRRGNKPVLMTVAYNLTTAQLATLETFVKTTTLGVKRFNFTHPRTLASVEVRLVAGSDGEYYSAAPIGAGVWRVGLTIEVLP